MTQRTLPSRTKTAQNSGPHDRGRRTRASRAPRTLWALVLLLVLAGAGVGLLASPLVDVRSVEVTGTERVSPQDVLAAAGVRDGSALATLDVQGVRDRVDALPAVASVSVHRSWPHTVRLVVTERTALAYETRPDGAVHLFDDEGLDFAVTASAPAGLPQLKLPSGPTRDDAARAAGSVLAGLPDALRTRVTVVQGQFPSSVALLLQDGRTVLWGAAGDAADTATKAAIVSTLEKERAGTSAGAAQADKGLEIDVSNPVVAVVR